MLRVLDPHTLEHHDLDTEPRDPDTRAWLRKMFRDNGNELYERTVDTLPWTWVRPDELPERYPRQAHWD